MIALVRHVRKKRRARQEASADAAGPNPGEQPGDAHEDAARPADGREALPVSRQRLVEAAAEKKAARKYRWKIIAGLIFPFALQALDVTIIASALPWIAVDFGEVAQLNWIISAFNLTAAAFIPFWGQMADIFGRHAPLQACVVIIMIGSALCTGAPTWAYPVLLLGRGLQGLGCAGISVIVRVILADKVSLKENAKNWSIFSFTAGMSYGIGPVIGGYLTNTNWRWCFGINLPICFAALLLIFFVLRKELLGPQPLAVIESTETLGRRTTFQQRLLTIDAGGQPIFLFGFGLLILAFTWAGATYAWNTAAVLVPLCLGTLLVVLFIFWEKQMAPGGVVARKWPYQRAMLPWKLISHRDIGLLFYITFATGAAMYSVLYFCNLYFTIVKQFPPAQAGVQLLYYTPGLGVGVYGSMFMCNVFPRKTFVPIMLGSVIEAIGIGVLAWALWSEHTATIYGMMGLTGAGTGLRFMPTTIHAIGFFPQNIASVISLMAVALPFGGTLALTVMTTVFNNTSGIAESSPFRDFTTLSRLPEPMKSQIIEGAKMGVVWAFVAITPFMLACIIAAMGLGNVDITKERLEEGDPGYGENVIHEPYLLHVLTRRRIRAKAATEAATKESTGNGGPEKQPVAAEA